MLAELLSALPQLAGILDKAGVIGALLIGVGVLFYERRRLMRQNVKVYRQRDRARLKEQRYLSRLQAEGIAVDVSDIDKLFEEDKDDET